MHFHLNRSFTSSTKYHLISCILECDLIFIPAASLASVGPQYWELIHRARAVDNQLFVAVISPARNENASYVVYGHSMIIDPNGTILSQAGISEEIVFYEISKNHTYKINKNPNL